MKLSIMNFLKLVLGNERGELGAAPSAVEKYMDDANLDSLGADDVDTTSEAVGDQPETESNETTTEENQEELSVEDQLNNLEVENGDFDESKFLESINDLGVLRKGLPVNIENMDDLKSMLSMGADYTYKSQEREKEFSDKETAFTERENSFVEKEQEFENRQNEFNEELTNNQIMAEALEGIQNNDPELFQDIMSYVKQVAPRHQGNPNDPVVKQLNGRLESVEQLLKNKENQEVEANVSRAEKEWEDGFKEVSNDYGLKLKKLGISPDWESVNKIWTSDENQSMSVKQAMLAVHGEQIQKALESSNKLNKTKLESAQRVGSGDTPLNNTNEQKDNSGNYMNYLMSKVKEKGF